MRAHFSQKEICVLSQKSQPKAIFEKAAAQIPIKLLLNFFISEKEHKTLFVIVQQNFYFLILSATFFK